MYKKVLIALSAGIIFSVQAQLIDLLSFVPTLIIDMRYASERNITHQVIYSQSCCYAHEKVATALYAVQTELLQQGLSLKIWDGYQPQSALRTIFNLIPDERYISNPDEGDAHTRGMAVDATLVDLQTGNDVEMPTNFDCVTQDSYCECKEVCNQARYYRAMLRESMLKYGFVQPSGSPWWHFEMAGWQEMDCCDISFEHLKSCDRK